MITKKWGHPCGGAPENNERILVNGNTSIPPTQLPEGILGPYLLRADDRALWDRLGTEAFFKLVARRPMSESVKREAINRYLAGKNCTAIWACAMAGPQTYPSERERPCFHCYDTPFVVGNKQIKAGVYYHFIDEQKVPVDRWICSVLRVVYIIRTKSGGEYSYLIEFVPHGETQPRRIVLPQSSLLAGGIEGMRILRDAGADVFGKHVKFILDYLDYEHHRFSAVDPDDFLELVKVVGWHPVGERFVLPGQIIGAPGGVWFGGGNAVQYLTGGKFEDWKTEVATPCIDNSYLQFALACAFAGPLLELLNIPGIGFHYYGDSTTGKTTALAIAASPWGWPERFMLSWRNTINGLEGQAVSRCSTLMPIDESHQIDPRVLDDAVYMLLNGIGKGRMRRDITLRNTDHWHNCLLSSGERSVETHQTAAKIDHKVGQTVRMIDVPVVNGPHGLFTNIYGAKNGAEFADTLREAASKHYGHTGPRFVAELINHYTGLDLHLRLADALQEFEKGGALSAQDRRVARNFAIAALAGELAIEWNILPWQKNSALIAALEIFHQWKATQPQSTQNKEVAQILTGFSGFIETREAEFSDADWTPQTDQYGRICNAEPVIHERAGYWKEINGSRIYCFNADGLKRASSGFGVRKAIEVLEAVGALTDKDPGKHSKKIWISQLKRSLSFYMIDPEKLELNP